MREAEIGDRSHSSVASAARKVVDEGYAVLRAVVEPELVRALLEAIDAALEELRIPFGANVFLGERTRRIFNLLGRGDVFARVPLHPAVLPIVDGVLDPECLLSSLTAVEMGAGETDQPFHADDGSIGLPKPHAPVTCTAIWALTDFTRENGGTRLVPGSHRFGRRPGRGERPEFVQAEMPAGSVLVYHGSLWHGGGANLSGERRVAIISNYCAGFLRQEENQLLALDRERVSGFPPRLRAMLGYSTYRGLMGHVEQRNPAELVDPDFQTEMVWKRMR
ncbi:MAG: phytanoyl-CoA dioxygenase family protein [Proteobacteria bacterium]|nr:phytanoyl-CoA dioxygenase family protein [Pseudomonadota bacterium]